VFRVEKSYSIESIQVSRTNRIKMTKEEASITEPPNKKARPSADHSNATKKGADAAIDGDAKSAAPPSYGSQEYWEQRYQKHQSDAATCTIIAEGKDNDDNTNDDKEKDGEHDVSESLPFHAWYFTYQDLRPLILPLILGGREEARGVMDEALAATSDADAIDESSKDGQKGNPEETKGEKDDDAPDDSDEDENGNASETEVEEEEDEDDEDDEEEGDFEEVGDDDEDEEEEEVEREGVACNGPISVLEVGCGDVPLGADLSFELEKLQQETGCSSQGIVKRIVCIDYSETVVHAMTKHYLSAPTTATDNDTKTKTDKSGGSLEFAVEDARHLSYPNESFELILEKGTLDAMLSNKESGLANCVLIVTECARVLTMGGYIVIISHLNAHTPNGISWLEEVVQTGLRAGGGNANWEIEVHGNDQVSTEGDPGIPAGSPGPAVYIIQKKAPSVVEGSKSATAAQDITIPVKFFAY
jgi:ubiquinone/menaquinone biosynthesis C-methylase UbiE